MLYCEVIYLLRGEWTRLTSDRMLVKVGYHRDEGMDGFDEAKQVSSSMMSSHSPQAEKSLLAYGENGRVHCRHAERPYRALSRLGESSLLRNM